MCHPPSYALNNCNNMLLNLFAFHSFFNISRAVPAQRRILPAGVYMANADPFEAELLLKSLGSSIGTGWNPVDGAPKAPLGTATKKVNNSEPNTEPTLTSAPKAAVPSVISREKHMPTLRMVNLIHELSLPKCFSR